jgi:6-phosphogluconate dehydrogenase
MTPSIARSAPLLSAAPNERFSWHGEENFADQLLSTVRFQFGGHEEKTAAKNGSA